ncbi:MAG: hypothetical protein ABIG46_00735 [Candidatus Omnitrophota bacterium]|nr:hypothetical protein [Candidatus Omnitrophota bacterium]
MRAANKAQSTLEYAVLIIVIAGALIAMKGYLDRAVQEKYRQGADVWGEGGQYAKGITQVNQGNISPAINPSVLTSEVCASVHDLAAKLEDELARLEVQLQEAENLVDQDDIEQKMLELEKSQLDDITESEKSTRIEGDEYAAQARALRAEAKARRDQADRNDVRADELEYIEYPDCMAGNMTYTVPCENLLVQAENLRSEAIILRAEAVEIDRQAEIQEYYADESYQMADRLAARIPEIQAGIPGFRIILDQAKNQNKSLVDVLKEKIVEKEEQIAVYKNANAFCFAATQP